MKPGRRSIFLVALREITERTQGRAFLISTIAIIAVVLAGVIVPALNDQTTRVAVTPASRAPRRPRSKRRCATPLAPTTHSWSCATTRPSPQARRPCATTTRTC